MWMEADDEAAQIASVADALERQAQSTKDPRRRSRLLALARAHREMLSAFPSTGAKRGRADELVEVFKAAA
jgi:hypothetical protein